MYQQASRQNPVRPEPYIIGLRLAREMKDVDAIEWAKGKTPQNIMTQRDSTLRAIRKYGAELAREGELEKW